MKELVHKLLDGGVKVICMSGMWCSLHSEAKKTFLAEHYGDNAELVSVCSQEKKLKLLGMFKNLFACSANEILYVDDNKENLTTPTGKPVGFSLLSVAHNRTSFSDFGI